MADTDSLGDVDQEEDKGPLGKTVAAPTLYCPSVLFPIARSRGRALLGLADSSAEAVPFVGVDVWNCYEASWFDARGLPTRRMLEIRVPSTSPNLVESKSLKLYLNSLNFHRFESTEVALDTITADLAAVLGEAPLSVSLAPSGAEYAPLLGPEWACIDQTDLGSQEVPSADGACADAAAILCLRDGAENGAKPAARVRERLVTHLLRTLCPVTGQPDWGSLLIEYEGSPISHAALLRYVVSLRCEVGFHENAIERVWLDLAAACKPARLFVNGRFMRRGGIDINPVRASRGDEAAAVLAAIAAAPQVRVPGQ